MTSVNDDNAKMLGAIAESFGVDFERINTEPGSAPLGLADHKSPLQIQQLVDDWLGLDRLEHALWISHTAQCGACAGPFVAMMKERLESEGF